MTPKGTVQVLGVALLAVACGAEGAGPDDVTISQEAFVTTYVALRSVGLRSPNQLPSEEDRDRILADHGVTQADLLTFAEVHGGDVDYIQGVWNEIEERLEALRTVPDSGGDQSS